MFSSFVTKSELINRVHQAVRLLFFRKGVKTSKEEQVERIENFVERFLKAYDFRSDMIHIDIRKNGIRIKLKNLRRYKSRERLDFLSKLDFLSMNGGK